MEGPTRPFPWGLYAVGLVAAFLVFDLAWVGMFDLTFRLQGAYGPPIDALAGVQAAGVAGGLLLVIVWSVWLHSVLVPRRLLADAARTPGLRDAFALPRRLRKAETAEVVAYLDAMRGRDVERDLRSDAEGPREEGERLTRWEWVGYAAVGLAGLGLLVTVTPFLPRAFAFAAGGAVVFAVVAVSYLGTALRLRAWVAWYRDAVG